MANLGGFNANTVEPNAARGPIPKAKYPALIEDSEMKATKGGDGQYLELVFQIIEGASKGRKLWVRLNLDNPNPKAVEIAKGELSAICRAVNVMTPQDSADLHNIPLIIDVGLKKRKDSGELENVINGYFRVGAPGSNGTATQPAMAAAGPSSPPWARKS